MIAVDGEDGANLSLSVPRAAPRRRTGRLATPACVRRRDSCRAARHRADRLRLARRRAPSLRDSRQDLWRRERDAGEHDFGDVRLPPRGTLRVRVWWSMAAPDPL